MTNDDVKARLAELQEAAAKAAEISVESICRELDQAIDVAKAKGQANAMVSAVALRAKLAGLLIDKSQVELNATVDVLDPRASYEDMAQAAFEELTNFRWLPIGAEDRLALAAIFKRFGDEYQAFMDEVRNRPLITTAYTVDGKPRVA